MQSAPRNLRLHVGIFGRRNAGKSSLLNALTGQETAIVSPAPGTTTDPVEKPLELPGVGPAILIDTAGLDDVGDLGEKRAERSRAAFDRADLALIAAPAGAWGEAEAAIAEELERRGVPSITVFTMADRARPGAATLAALAAKGLRPVTVAAPAGEGLESLRAAIVAAAPESVFDHERLVADLLPPDGAVVLVVPVDTEAPRGRLILPQVMTIRNLLDHERMSVVTTVGGLPKALAALKDPPCLVVTDSQAFAAVAAAVPAGVPLTGFSVLFARCMGDLPTQAAGTRAIRELKPGARVLVAEGGAHHPGGEDIGRVKIPRLLEKRAGGALVFDHVQGRDFPSDLSPYRLVVMCGGCMNNRREMLSRIFRCREQGVPVSNYGLAIAECLGILDRALQPFGLG